MCYSLQLWAVLLCAHSALGIAPASQEASSSAINWFTDYGKANQVAEADGKRLLIYFQDERRAELCRQFETRALSDPQIVARLAGYVSLRLPVDATIVSGGKPVRLLAHPSLAEMLNEPGVAIIDYASRDAGYYGLVVSTFPLPEGRPYTPFEMSVILDLPPGTLTQRTLIYAVRTHPERPASTCGKLEPCLVKEAESHSRYQARLRLQGHHNWNSRFHRINARLSFGLLASEVCAESWPGQSLLQAAIECVHSWRLSSGHWSAVCARQQVYGYDMKRGTNGIWYATGIFGRR
jgi:hypothetical protein